MRGNRGDQQPTLNGRRVRLRPWRADDAGAVYEACQDPEIQKWTQVPVPYRIQHAEHFVGELAPRTWGEGGGLFAVEPVDGGRWSAAWGSCRRPTGSPRPVTGPPPGTAGAA